MYSLNYSVSSDRKRKNSGRPGGKGHRPDGEQGLAGGLHHGRTEKDGEKDSTNSGVHQSHEKHEKQEKYESRHEHHDSMPCAHHEHHDSAHPKGLFGAHCSSPAEWAMGSLMRTAKMIHRFGEARIAQNKHYGKLSGPRMGVLFIVHHSGGIRMGDLAGKLHVAPRTVTDLVDGLERDGFIHRIPDPTDRRASLLELSESAKRDFDQIASMRKAFVEEIFSPLSNDEKDTLVSLLTKLREGPIRDLLRESLETVDDEK